MKTILLYAKKFAIDSGSKEVTLEHFKKAVECLGINDDNFLKMLKGFDVDIKPAKVLNLSEKAIKETEAANPIKTSSELCELTDKLERFGITINTKIRKELNPKKRLSKAAKLKKSKEIFSHINTLRDELNKKVIGQKEAVDAFCKTLLDIKLNENENVVRNAPRVVFTLIGPPSSGKSFLVEKFSELVTDEYEYKYKNIDLSLYTREDDNIYLIGNFSGYHNAQPGDLTSFVRENPKSIIVIDNFEKGNNTLQHVFLTLFDKGIIKDRCGFYNRNERGDLIQPPYAPPEVDFSEVILIFTTNVGKELYSNVDFLDKFKEDKIGTRKMIFDAISREMKIDDGKETSAVIPSFLSRLRKSNVILFNRLKYNDCLKIVSNMFTSYVKNFIETSGIDLKFQDNDLFAKMILLANGPEFDLREIPNLIYELFFSKVYDYLTKNVPDKVYIEIDKESENFIINKVDKTDDNEDLLLTMFKKNRTLDFKKTEFKEEKDILTTTFKELNFKKVKKAIDFGGKGGFIIEVPEDKYEKIAGHNKVKEQLKEYASILKDENLKKFTEFVPKGLLLYGPPGTGKTMLARAFANEADLPFIATTGPELLNIDFMDEIFKKAYEYAPSIVFIDEIDVFKQRGLGYGTDITVNHLLAKIDGFSNKSNEKIFIIAATNNPRILDKALVRSGRIDIHIEASYLDTDARKFFINNLFDKDKFEESIYNNDKIVRLTVGFSGADLQKLENECVLYIKKHNIPKVTEDILKDQIINVKYGEKKTIKNLEEYIAETAYHEAGHAVVSKVIFPKKDIEMITASPREYSMGLTSFSPDDKPNLSRDDIKGEICVCLAGRLAQIKKFGDAEGYETGASQDLENATSLIYRAIFMYGMDEEVGNINLSGLINEYMQEPDLALRVSQIYGAKTAEYINKWLNEGVDTTKEIIERHWNKIELTVKALLEKEVIMGEELENILKKEEHYGN